MTPYVDARRSSYQMGIRKEYVLIFKCETTTLQILLFFIAGFCFRFRRTIVRVEKRLEEHMDSFPGSFCFVVGLQRS